MSTAVELNVVLLKQLRAFIADIPDIDTDPVDGRSEAFCMDGWIDEYQEGQRSDGFCGTALCIAGATVYLAEPPSRWHAAGYADRAINLLLPNGRGTDEHYRAARLLRQLFYVCDWPGIPPQDTTKDCALFLLDTLVNGGLDAFEALYDEDDDA